MSFKAEYVKGKRFSPFSVSAPAPAPHPLHVRFPLARRASPTAFYTHAVVCVSPLFEQNLEEINVLRITLDTQIEDLEQHFETAHINYLQVRVASKGRL